MARLWDGAAGGGIARGGAAGGCIAGRDTAGVARLGWYSW